VVIDMQKIIGIGEMAISNDINDTLKTYALGSCVGVTVYSPKRKVGGLIHIALPSPSRISDVDARRCFYASTGLPFFMGRFYQEFGCSHGELIINVFGGANSIRDGDTFNVGRKNVEFVRKYLNGEALKINAMETGENLSRTVQLAIATGEITVWHQKIII